ncbi:MAG TPA: 30S ribosomal protein S16 [Aquifex aeolicus]|uniref:Small ribosomal subunit protein bS16 n=1 Tax=Aquifex aeolicus TaxID=63363 RepID=A0A7C5LAK2_AQUAO|nr:30S ribosomal protein S16 [Aquifex aeolicus]
MAVRIRLARFGRRRHPVYRIVVMDAKSPREGNYIDILGTYDPKRKVLIEIKPEKVRRWLQEGVEIAGRAKAILESADLLKDLVPGDRELRKSGDYWVLRKKTTKEVNG